MSVLPLVQRTARALGGWLAPAWGGELRLAPDLDSVEALAPERETLWKRVDGASFLTEAEKRAAVGYGDDGRLGLTRKYRPDQERDEYGRWVYEGLDGEEGDDGGDLAEFVPTAGRGPGKPPTAPPKSPPAPGQQPPATTVPIPPGATIRNKDLAGKKHPDTGIPFDKDGFPDFSSVAQKTVRVPQTGGRADAEAANKAAGLASTPRGMVWHHHQDGYTMQLVPESIHRGTGHTGSRGIGNLPGRK